MSAGRPKKKRATLAVIHGARRTAPKAPEWFGPEARDAWDQAAAILLKAGMLSDATLPLLEQYASAMGTVRQCEAALGTQGAFFAVKGKPPVPHPAFAMKSDALKGLRILSVKLGLAPDKDHTPRPKPEAVDDDFSDLDL